jgi:hypothetical protein
MLETDTETAPKRSPTLGIRWFGAYRGRRSNVDNSVLSRAESDGTYLDGPAEHGGTWAMELKLGHAWRNAIEDIAAVSA